MSWLFSSFCASLLVINTTWEITCLWQNHSFVANKCLLSITSNVTNKKSELWKTVRQTSHGFRNHNCNPFQSLSSLSMRVSFCISMLSIPCFHVFSGYFCFTQFGGGSHCLDFNQFCDTAPLMFHAPHICRIALWWIATRRYLSYFYRWKATSNKGEKKMGRSLGPLTAGQALAEIKIIGFLLSQYMTDHKLVQLRYHRCSQLID